MRKANDVVLTNHINDLMDCLEAYINSSDNEQETAKLKELQSYYSENREALSGLLRQRNKDI